MASTAALKKMASTQSARLLAAMVVVNERRVGRDKIIVDCFEAGVTYDELCALTGLSYEGVRKVVRNGRAEVHHP